VLWWGGWGGAGGGGGGGGGGGVDTGCAHGAGERVRVEPNVGGLGGDHPRDEDARPRGEHAVGPDEDGDLWRNGP